MFTGIVTDIGEIDEITDLDHGKRFRVKTAYDTATIDIGASIAHAGTCLTVVAKGDDWYEVEAWEEALRLSKLGALMAGSRINLERALKIGDELGGHLVSGHVDGQAKVVAITEEGQAIRYHIEAPADLARFIVQKGSVCLDGTSLTVNTVEGNSFDVLLIRHTQEVTTWGAVKAGDSLNLEVDQMARYAARLAEIG